MESNQPVTDTTKSNKTNGPKGDIPSVQPHFTELPLTSSHQTNSDTEPEAIESGEHMSSSEITYMEKAFFYAREALDNQEVPVGCIFVYRDQIVALGRNTVNETRNATRHAEINCIEQVTAYCGEKGLNLKEVFGEVDVYVTVEPCIMCAAALYELKVKSVVFGCKNDRFGGQTVLDVAELLKPPTTVKGGYREEEAMHLLKTFYKGTNPNAPSSKVKMKKDVS